MSVRQIAKLAGVSPATVSMALHHHPKLSDATRRRIGAIAKRIGYKTNAKITELMGQIRSGSAPKITACLGVISFYQQERPWVRSQHLERMYNGMVRRANALGYRLEPFWLKSPVNTPRRIRAILDARGIEGLLCLGSPNFDEDFPVELNQFAIVTQGLSIRTHLHRILNHAYNDTRHALERAYQEGYRRPGLILSKYEDVRGEHSNLSAYFGWCEKMLGAPAPISVLRLSDLEEKPLLTWLKLQRPDVVLIVHESNVLAKIPEFLRKHEIRVPQDLGVIALSQVLTGTNFSGFEENAPLMGAWAVELLMARILNRDFGIPTHPRIEMVESRWIEGRSLRTLSS